MKYPVATSFVQVVDTPVVDKDQPDSIFGGFFKLGNLFKKKTVDDTTVEIKVVNESLYFGGARTISEDEMITVVYDHESLDSLYGLSFFMFLYGDRVQAIPYHSQFASTDVIKESAETVILGVEISPEDLESLNELTKSIRIMSYHGSFEYLYDNDVKKNYKNITLFQAENEFFIGGKNIGMFENTIAMMIKILYFYSNEWNLWKQSQYAMMVAHYTCFFPGVPDYGLTRSTLKYEMITDEKGKQKKQGVLTNDVEALMWDFKTNLESALQTNSKMFEVIPTLKLNEYGVYCQRLKTHIARSRKLQGWREPGVMIGTSYYAHCVPAIAYSVQDIIALSCMNVHTTVCVENTEYYTLYYVYSKNINHASTIARVIDGEHSWKQGNIFCVSKRKALQERH